MLSRRISGRKIVCQAEGSRFRLSRVIFTRLSTAKRVWRGRNGGCKRKRFGRGATDRPTDPSTERRGKGCFSVVNSGAATSRCTDMHYAKQRMWKRNETKGGRKRREGIVECWCRRCSMSSGCNEQNGEFLGEDMYSGLLFFLVTFRLSVDECNISLFFLSLLFGFTSVAVQWDIWIIGS